MCRRPTRALALSLSISLILPALASADDVEIQLGSGDDFVIQDSTSTERWRIDQQGNLTRSGSMFIHKGYNDASIAIGYGALDVLTVGGDNVAIGNNALGMLTSGNDNLALGEWAGSSLSSGQNNIYIHANSASSSESYQIRLGAVGIHANTTIAGQVSIPFAPDVSLSGDGALMLGPESTLNIAIDGNEIQARNNGAVSSLFLNAEGGNIELGRVSPAGRVRMNWINAAATVHTDANGWLYGLTSTRRHKRNIEPFEDDYEKLLSLQPYTYEYLEGDRFPEGEFLGFMAEDIDQAGMSRLVHYDNEGKPVSIAYEEFSVYLIGVLKQQKSELSDLGRDLAAQSDQNAALLGRLDALEARLAERDGEDEQ